MLALFEKFCPEDRYISLHVHHMSGGGNLLPKFMSISAFQACISFLSVSRKENFKKLLVILCLRRASRFSSISGKSGALLFFGPRGPQSCSSEKNLICCTVENVEDFS